MHGTCYRVQDCGLEAVAQEKENIHVVALYGQRWRNRLPTL